VAISDSDQAVIERWSGPIATTDTAAVEGRLARLGNAYMVALELLLITRAEMAMSATIVSSGDDRSDHTANLKAIQAQIDRLLAYILANDLGTDDNLLGEAAGSSVAATASVTIDARNRRRG